MAKIEIPYEEWEVLYRQRLQIERDLRAASMSDVTTDGGTTTDHADQTGLLGTLSKVGGLLRTGAEVVLEAAADEETGKTLDRLAGTEWRWAARAASLAASAAREAVAEPRDADVDAGEPIGAAATDAPRAGSGRQGHSVRDV